MVSPVFVIVRRLAVAPDAALVVQLTIVSAATVGVAADGTACTSAFSVAHCAPLSTTSGAPEEPLPLPLTADDAVDVTAKAIRPAKVPPPLQPANKYDESATKVMRRTENGRDANGRTRRDERIMESDQTQTRKEKRMAQT